ncbi:MAG: hypothetical protein PF961_17970 [Planctomycetota bacterium]|jgi:DNA-directed RNA polymerase subunit RPC12/RpoP|nr:hypothetical protein [Planctomycetota bacterium]
MQHRRALAAVQIFGIFIASIFGLIGLTMLVTLWGISGFGSPPLIFKLFGSFICLAFIGVSAFIAIGALRGPVLLRRAQQANRSAAQTQGTPAHRSPAGTAASAPASNDCLGCPNCGAAVTSDDEISPSGDVKCRHCTSWFNVRARSTPR